MLLNRFMQNATTNKEKVYHRGPYEKKKKTDFQYNLYKKMHFVIEHKSSLNEIIRIYISNTTISYGNFVTGISYTLNLYSIAILYIRTYIGIWKVFITCLKIAYFLLATFLNFP